jgi:hypothetical protein
MESTLTPSLTKPVILKMPLSKHIGEKLLFSAFDGIAISRECPSNHCHAYVCFSSTIYFTAPSKIAG